MSGYRLSPRNRPRAISVAGGMAQTMEVVMSTEKPSRRRVAIPGEPNLYQRGNRTVLRMDVDGKEIVRSFRTLTEAKRERGRLEARMSRIASRTPFDEYSDDWIENYSGRKGEGANDETRDTYRDSLRNRAKPFFGKVPLERIDGPWLKRYVTWLSAGDKRRKLAPLAPASVRRHFAVVRALLNSAHDDGHLTHNPVAGFRVVIPGSRPTKAKRLTPAETVKLLAKIPVEHADVTHLMATGGLRPSEALNPRREDLGHDPDGNPILTIRKSKTVAGESSIILTPDTARMLTRRLNTLQDKRPDAPLFPNAVGGVYDRRNWTRRVFKPAAEAAGVSWASPKALRHGVGSLMAEHGFTAAQIAAQLRHADGGVLALRTYVHPEQPNVAFLDAIVKRPETPDGSELGPTPRRKARNTRKRRTA
jgi:integrase